MYVCKMERGVKPQGSTFHLSFCILLIYSPSSCCSCCCVCIYILFTCRHQMSTGQEAVNYFSTGIQLLHNELDRVMAEMQAAGPAPDADLVEAAKSCSAEISFGFCSVAEIYLTDLCMEEVTRDTGELN